MTKQQRREPLTICTQCQKSLYAGDLVCDFYADEKFCEEHATTLKEAISHQEELVKMDDSGPFDTMEELKADIAYNRRKLMREGNCKPYLSVLS